MSTAVQNITSGSGCEKPELLYLCHRIPFPPDKGDKIRSFHLLGYLAQHYRVYLGCFIDDVLDQQYIGDLSALCEEVHCETINPRYARLRSLSGLFCGAPLTLPYYQSQSMQQWVSSRMAEKNISRCVIFSSAMAQFLMPYWRSNSQSVSLKSTEQAGDTKGIRVLVDFVDVDSDKWRQYADSKPFPVKWLYQREANRLLNFEKSVAQLADGSFFVSQREAALFKALAPEAGVKIRYYNNGVDSDYFNPGLSYRNPYRHASPVLLFTGAMDYWPNIDAVSWFAEQIFPSLRGHNGNLKFYVVGRNPTTAVKKLARIPGVEITGRVDDIRPYIKYATAVVAPLRIARGIQNKVLEAMAMEKVVMASDAALEGINAELGGEILLTNSLEDYQEFLPQVLKSNCLSIERAARARVMADFNWQNTLPVIGSTLESRRQWELEHE